MQQTINSNNYPSRIKDIAVKAKEELEIIISNFKCLKPVFGNCHVKYGYSQIIYFLDEFREHMDRLISEGLTIDNISKKI